MPHTHALVRQNAALSRPSWVFLATWRVRSNNQSQFSVKQKRGSSSLGGPQTTGEAALLPLRSFNTSENRNSAYERINTPTAGETNLERRFFFVAPVILSIHLYEAFYRKTELSKGVNHRKHNTESVWRGGGGTVLTVKSITKHIQRLCCHLTYLTHVFVRLQKRKECGNQTSIPPSIRQTP